MNPIKFEFLGLLEHGLVTHSEMHEYHDTVTKALELLLQWKKEGRVGFLDLPFKEQENGRIFECGKKLQKKYKYFVQCGIGGSSLGAQTLTDALAPDALVYYVDNVDPHSFEQVLKKINLKETIFHVVSKSGETIETIEQYKWIVKSLKSQKCKLKNHIIVSTNEYGGFLYEEIKKNKYPFFVIPENVGGRFSVFTSVGLLASTFAGICINKLLKGAAHVDRNEKASLAEYVCCALVLHKKQSRKTAGFLIYSDRLSSFGNWIKQLWAESLGKQKDLEGRDVFEGSFPLVERGTPAQHSILQLLMEGPSTAWVQFIDIDTGRVRLLNAASHATRESLLSNKKPCVRMKLLGLNEESLGALLYFYEVAVALFGLSLNINPFDQPGVEDSKKRIRQVLSSNTF